MDLILQHREEHPSDPLFGRMDQFSTLRRAYEEAAYIWDILHKPGTDWPAKSRQVAGMRAVAAERGGIWMAEEWRGSARKEPVCCGEGHEWKDTASHLKYGDWCPKCSEKFRLALKQIEREERLERERRQQLADKATRQAVNHSKWFPRQRLRSENTVRAMLTHALGLEFPAHSPKQLESMGIRLRNSIGGLMHLDGYCPTAHIAFEYHGIQHTDPTVYFHRVNRDPNAFRRRQADDQLKRKQCREQGITLIEVFAEQYGGWSDLDRLYIGVLEELRAKELSTSRTTWEGSIFLPNEPLVFNEVELTIIQRLIRGGTKYAWSRYIRNKSGFEEMSLEDFRRVIKRQGIK